MTDQKEALWLLGAFDAEIEELTRRLAELPRSIAEVEEKARAAREVIDQERKILDESERVRRAKEGDLQDCEARREKFQAQSALVKTNTEYSALMSEIDTTTARISAIEEEILVAMETADQAMIRLKDVEQEQTRTEQECMQRAEQLLKEMGEVKQTIEQKQKERDALLTVMGPEVKTRYERVRELRGTGTARVRDQSCVACHRQVPPETINRVLAGELHTCGSCQRILVATEE
jgi:predicted  nucleic acid-binding Zn-ribbon protein